MEFTGERFIPGAREGEIRIEHEQRYYAIQDFVADKIVLDAACGEGYGARILSKHAGKVVGMDISQACINNANEKYANSDLSFVQGSVDALPFDDECFDVIVSFETIEHINAKMQDAFLKESRRVLKPDGVVIISTPNKLIYSDKYQQTNKFHVKEFYIDEFTAFLKQTYPEVRTYYQKQEVVSLIADSRENSLRLEERISQRNIENDTKYIICFCSQHVIGEPKISSLTFDPERTYLKMLDRIIELQGSEAELQLKLNRPDGEAERIKEWADRLDKYVDTYQDTAMYKLYYRIHRLKGRVFKVGGNTYCAVKAMKLFLKSPKSAMKAIREDGIKGVFNQYRLDRVHDYLTKPTYQQVLYEYEAMFGIERYEPKQVTLDEPQAHMLSIPKSDNPLVSIIIPAFNGFDMNLACIAAVIAHTSPDISYEVIFVDDVSNDETKHIETYIDNLIVIRNKENKGFLINNNEAAKTARGGYLMLLNNDTQVQPGWLQPLARIFETHPDAGVVGSKLIYPDGGLQESGGILWQDGSAWNYGRNDNPMKSQYNYMRECDYISGAAMMVKKSIWDEVGGFDARYAPAYCEDSDLAMTMRSKGYKVYVQPKSIVVHFEGQSNGTNKTEGIKSYQTGNQIKLLEKWQEVLSKEHLPNGTDVFHAAGRTVGKKTILFIENHIPEYDKDAGSKTALMLFKTALALGYHVKFLSAYFTKQEPYASELETMGIEVLGGSWYMKNIGYWMEQSAPYIDYCFITRPYAGEQFMPLIKRYPNIKRIYFVADLHYLRTKRQYEISREPELLAESGAMRQTEAEIFKDADVVVTVSRDEEQIIKKEFRHKNVKLIPIYAFEEAGPKPEAQTEGLLFVGGFRHPPNLDGIMWFIKEVLPLIWERDPSVTLDIAGSHTPDELKVINDSRIHLHGFVSEAELEALYKSCRTVIIPLRFGAGVKGKTVEAMYFGRPIVSTSIGIEGLKDIQSIITPTDSEKDFAERVLTLYNGDKEMLDDVEAKARQYITANFSIEAAEKSLKAILDE